MKEENKEEEGMGHRNSGAMRTVLWWERAPRAWLPPQPPPHYDLPVCT